MMDESKNAIKLSGGSSLVDEKVKNFWGCWYGTANMTATIEGMRGMKME